MHLLVLSNEMKSWPSIQKISAWINVRFFSLALHISEISTLAAALGLHLVFFFFKERVYIVVLYWAASSHMCGTKHQRWPKRVLMPIAILGGVIEENRFKVDMMSKCKL